MCSFEKSSETGETIYFCFCKSDLGKVIESARASLKFTYMKRILLLAFASLLLSSTNMVAQSDRMQHPISSARIVGVDGKAELVFDEALSDAFTVSVFDLTGKVMFTLRHDTTDEACESVELPVENLRKGIYMVQVIGGDGKTKTLKLQRN